MGKIESIGPVDLRMWLVVDGDGCPLQIFKGSAEEAVAGAEKAYPLRSGIQALDAASLWESPQGLLKLQFATTLAFAEWLCTQFAMLQQMAQARVMPAAGLPPVPRRH